MLMSPFLWFQTVIKEGVLSKQNSSFQRSKRRYFKLRGRTLYYAKTAKVRCRARTVGVGRGGTSGELQGEVEYGGGGGQTSALSAVSSESPNLPGCWCYFS